MPINRQQEQMMASQGYITPPEAARRIGITPVSVMRLVEAHGVTTQRAGRWWYLEVKSLASVYDEAPLIKKAILTGEVIPSAEAPQTLTKAKKSKPARNGTRRRKT